ncbi:MAG: ABC transporter permease [Clostridium sp.]
MLGKLLKYEFKATGRIFLPMYLVILVVAIINGFMLDINTDVLGSGNMQMIGFLVLFALVIALAVITIVVTIQRFYKSLLGDEGYLMFTLPVSVKSLVLSKGIVATIWSILSGIVSVAAFGIIVFMQVIKAMIVDSEIREIMNMISFSDLFNSVKSVVPVEVYSGIGTVIWIVVVITIVSYLSTVFGIYLSMAIGQMPKFTGYKVAASIIAFFVISFVTSTIFEFIAPTDLLEVVETPISLIKELKEFTYYIAGYSIVECIALFFGTTYILEKKLNLS